MSVTLLIQNGDVVVSAVSGRPNTISDGAALKQLLTENLTIDVQPNGFGAGIGRLVGIVPNDSILITILLDRCLNDSIAAIKHLQSFSPQGVRPNNELVQGITSLKAMQSIADPRRYVYILDILTRAGLLRFSGSIG